MGALIEQYIDSARHSLIYREDFFPADWYFGPEYAEFCSALLSKTRLGVDHLVAFVPIDQDRDYSRVLAGMAEEFFMRFRDSRGFARLVLVSVIEGADTDQMRQFVGIKREARKSVFMLAVDVTARKIASVTEFGPDAPGALSIGFSRPADDPQKVDEAAERKKALRYFRSRARSSLVQSRGLGSNAFSATVGIIGLNVLVFLLEEAVGGSTSSRTLVLLGANYTPLIRAGQYWRVFTYQFLHVGLIHLLVNSFSLYNLGPFIERVHGTVRFAAIYLVAGTVGGLASAALSPFTLSAGASGAIFGLLGALGAHMVSGGASRQDIARTIGMPLVVSLIYGFMLRIDHFAHIGGLIGGFLMAMVFDGRRSRDGTSALVVLLVLVALLCWRLFM